MLLVIKKKVTVEQMKKMAEDFGGDYIKVVVDVKIGILAGGGERHVDGEQKLLGIGSKQKDLWGGGIDVKTQQIDYNSMINLRPSRDNPSRDILSQDIRERMDGIIKSLIL